MKFKKKLLACLTMVFLIAACFTFPAIGATTTDNENITLILKGTPFEMGKQYGEQAKDAIESNLELFWKLSKEKGLTQQQVVDEAKTYEETLLKTAPKQIEKMKGMADGSGISYDDILALNAAAHKVMPEGCTIVVASGKATKDGKVYFQKNRDASPAPQVVLQVQPSDGYKYIAITSAGLTSIAMGINEKGLSTGNNYLPTSDVDFSEGHLDNLVINTLILEKTASVREAVDYIESLPRMMGSNYVVADTEEVAFVETSHSAVAVKWVVDEALAHTNHYILPEMEQYNPGQIGDSTKVRFERASELLQQDVGKLDIHRLIKISEDQDGPHSNNWISRSNTVCAGTFDGTKCRMWAQVGQPSIAPAVPFEVDRPHIPTPFNSGKQSERIEKIQENKE